MKIFSIPLNSSFLSTCFTDLPQVNRLYPYSILLPTCHFLRGNTVTFAVKKWLKFATVSQIRHAFSRTQTRDYQARLPWWSSIQTIVLWLFEHFFWGIFVENIFEYNTEKVSYYRFSERVENLNQQKYIGKG